MIKWNFPIRYKNKEDNKRIKKMEFVRFINENSDFKRAFVIITTLDNIEHPAIFDLNTEVIENVPKKLILCVYKFVDLGDFCYKSHISNDMKQHEQFVKTLTKYQQVVKVMEIEVE